MGGVIFIGAIVFMVALCYILGMQGIIDVAAGAEMLMLMVISLVYGAIGFIDDYIKVVKKRNLRLCKVNVVSASACCGGGVCLLGGIR